MTTINVIPCIWLNRKHSFILNYSAFCIYQPVNLFFKNFGSLTINQPWFDQCTLYTHACIQHCIVPSEAWAITMQQSKNILECFRKWQSQLLSLCTLYTCDEIWHCTPHKSTQSSTESSLLPWLKNIKAHLTVSIVCFVLENVPRSAPALSCSWYRWEEHAHFPGGIVSQGGSGYTFQVRHFSWGNSLWLSLFDLVGFTPLFLTIVPGRNTSVGVPSRFCFAPDSTDGTNMPITEKRWNWATAGAEFQVLGLEAHLKHNFRFCNFFF